MKRKNWRRYVVMGFALLMVLALLAGLIIPFLER